MRIEDSQIFSEQTKAMAREIEKEIRPVKIKRGKFLGCGSCFFTCLIILLAVFIFGLWAAAKTGLWGIPFFSDWFYKTPEPLHWVSPAGEKFSPEKILSDGVKESLPRGNIAGQSVKIPVNLTITEGELTELLRAAENGLNNNNFGVKFSGSQIAVSEEALELFTKAVIKGERETFLTVRVIPEVREKKIELHLLDVKLGDLELPALLGNYLVKNFLEGRLNELSEKNSSFGEITAINLKDGKMIINTKLNIEVFKK
ncbi:MAG: hypothetical protein PHD51_04735 [Patescibacteria group bacterium]|nr:hypothetical protein [Patescibacteria group bacterium]MDD5043926.1 hypothetical protein [Patescibacteria group bacterium]MDD5490759.1 hypothetical protein [Patescibacteria group bacterium]